MTSRFAMALLATAELGARMHLSGRVAPNLGEPLGAAAPPFVVFIAHRILVVIILVVVLRGGEGRDRLDLGRDLLLEAAGDVLLRRLGQLVLLVIGDEDDGAIGRD